MTAPLIRPERAEDVSQVHALLKAAFDGAVEADMVDKLRGSGDLVLALVADQQGIAGYVAFPRLNSSISAPGPCR